MKHQELNIDIAGSIERANAMNGKLLQDLYTTNTRPFLDKSEKIEFQTYYSDWARNNFIALLNFDKAGNFLPDAYSAPKDILRLLYPIDDIMSYERQGTIVIDREQYTPALKNLSFFIYIVDEELYNEYFDKQNYNIERGSRPYMFDIHSSNGVRVFKNYFELARHLRKNRLVTYILGPRAIYYLRFYLHQIHLHTVEDDYAYGRKVDATIANAVVEQLKETLAYRNEQSLTYNAKVKEDDYTLVRVLAKKYRMNLPDIRKYSNKTEITRLSKMHINTRPCTVKKNKLTKFANQFGVQPYHSCILSNGYWLFFIWDTRKIELAIPEDQIDQNDLCLVKWDNGFDLSIKYEPAKQELWDICKTMKDDVAIQFRNNNLL